MTVWICSLWLASAGQRSRRFLAPCAVNSIVSSMQEIHEGTLRGNQVLIYMSGREDEQELTKPLERLARVKRRLPR